MKEFKIGQTVRLNPNLDWKYTLMGNCDDCNVDAKITAEDVLKKNMIIMQIDSFGRYPIQLMVTFNGHRYKQQVDPHEIICLNDAKEHEE